MLSILPVSSFTFRTTYFFYIQVKYTKIPKNLPLTSSWFQRPHQGTTDTQVGHKCSKNEQRSSPGIILYKELHCRSQEEGPNATA